MPATRVPNGMSELNPSSHSFADKSKEKGFGRGVDGTRIDNVLAPAHLRQHVRAECNLADGNSSGGDLASAKNETERHLAKAECAGGRLAETEHQPDARLADRDQTERHVPNRDHAARETTDGNDAAGRDSLAGFRADAVRVVNEGQVAELKMRLEFREPLPAGIKEASPYAVRRFLDEVLDVFQ